MNELISVNVAPEAFDPLSLTDLIKNSLNWNRTRVIGLHCFLQSVSIKKIPQNVEAYFVWGNIIITKNRHENQFFSKN